MSCSMGFRPRIVKLKETYEMAGRKPKGQRDETFNEKHGTKRTTVRLAPELLAAAASVRAPGETFTAQVEEGLDLLIRRRRRGAKRATAKAVSEAAAGP